MATPTQQVPVAGSTFTIDGTPFSEYIPAADTPVPAETPTVSMDELKSTLQSSLDTTSTTVTDVQQAGSRSLLSVSIGDLWDNGEYLFIGKRTVFELMRAMYQNAAPTSVLVELRTTLVDKYGNSSGLAAAFQRKPDSAQFSQPLPIRYNNRTARLLAEPLTEGWTRR